MVSSTRLLLLTKLVTLGVLITCTVLLTGGVNLVGYINTRAQQATDPKISVKDQSDAPIRLTVLTSDSSDPNAQSILVEVTNVGTKAIRAYAISQETTRGLEKSSGFMLADMGIIGEPLQSGQYSTDSVAYTPFSDGTSYVSLIVDFVEFEDGTVWGPDAEKSSEMLAGRRAGEREAGKRLVKFYKETGIQRALKALDESSLETVPPQGHTPEWEEGFSSGQRAIPQRLKRAMSKGGAVKVEKELRKLSEKLAGDK